MKKSFLNLQLNLVVIAVGLVLFAGCKQPSKNGVRAASANQRNNVVTGTAGGTGTGSTTWSAQCHSGQSLWGTIYEGQASSGSNFEQRVKSFLSATTAPEEIGTISGSANDPSTGVRFQGIIKVNRQTGAVDLAQSKIKITVYDSFAATGQQQPINVSINTAHSGQFNISSGAGSVVFKDNYGEVKLEGSVGNERFSGRVSYINTTAVNGGSPSSGVLGDFYIATCAMIQ